MSISKPLLALVMLSSAGFAGRAFATTAPSSCSSDVDCGHGYTCQSSTIISTPTPAPCPPDTDCKATEGGGGTGASVTVSTCEPGPCATDSDCGSDMVCHTETSSACSGGTAPECPPNTKCDTPADATPPTCTTTTTSRCTFRWQLPCSADADCGAGFVCQPSVYGVCGASTVSSGAGAAPSGGAVTSPPAMCTTTTSFPGWCQAAATSCVTDSDCPSNWSCQDGAYGRGTPVSTTGAGGVGGAGGGAEPIDSNTGTGAALEIDPIAPTKVCMAPFGAAIDAKEGGDGGHTGTAGTGRAPENTAGTGGTLGATPAPTVGATNGTDGTGADEDAKIPSASNQNAGCAVSPAAAHSGSGAAALLTLFGLGLVAVRRRRS